MKRSTTCYMCDPELDPNSTPFDPTKHRVCLICAHKMARLAMGGESMETCDCGGCTMLEFDALGGTVCLSYGKEDNAPEDGGPADPEDAEADWDALVGGLDVDMEKLGKNLEHQKKLGPKQHAAAALMLSGPAVSDEDCLAQAREYALFVSVVDNWIPCTLAFLMEQLAEVGLDDHEDVVQSRLFVLEDIGQLTMELDRKAQTLICRVDPEMGAHLAEQEEKQARHQRDLVLLALGAEHGGSAEVADLVMEFGTGVVVTLDELVKLELAEWAVRNRTVVRITSDGLDHVEGAE